MENLKIEATEFTPQIECNSSENRILIYGRSIPENALNFYSPVINWIEEYKSNISSRASLEFYLDYVNSISQKIILDILRRFSQLKADGKQIKVLWKYEKDDEEMKDEGQFLSSKVDLDFELIRLQD